MAGGVRSGFVRTRIRDIARLASLGAGCERRWGGFHRNDLYGDRERLRRNDVEYIGDSSSNAKHRRQAVDLLRPPG
jgi:hypothetical protein